MKRHALFRPLRGPPTATLHYTEYRFVIIEHSVEIYGALVAIIFATFGIWLGLRIAQKRRPAGEPATKEAFVPAETAVPGSFTPNTANRQSLGITARELEILTLIAAGFSN